MKVKIINDPVYGFLRFPEPEVMQVIAHPWFQRLRHIKQMGMANLVYPGAVHTRLHHSLGACHLMGEALGVLQSKQISFTREECVAAKLAILMHDIGHGPFSHGLEHSLVTGISHEDISRLIMKRLNAEMNGRLTKAIEIFDHAYPKKYLHQLVSSQLDMDRMDYLNRDSFFTGVSEGVIGYDRILQMLTVKDDELMVEEKAVHSVEKFIIARRLMYWQVYLHKTVLSAEKMLVRIVERARQLLAEGIELPVASPDFHYFLKEKTAGKNFSAHLENFTRLDDTDVMCTLKNWCGHSDKILSILCQGVVDRKLLKVRFQSEPFAPEQIEKLCRETARKLEISEEDAAYFVFTGEAENTTYNPFDEHIKILFKDGTISDISRVDNALIHQQVSSPVKKYYLCYLR